MGLTRRSVLRAAIATSAAAAAGVATVATAGIARAAGTPCEPRYLGYRGADHSAPYAHYFQPRTIPVQPQVAQAYNGPAVAAASIPRLSALTTDLAPTGYSAVETGYGSFDGITVWAAALTTMPRVTAQMWDWWFGWHSTESARYKLWHPSAHEYAALAHDLTGAPGLTDRQKYVGNTTFVDELIGTKLEQLAINFRDPVAAGFVVPENHTIIYGRVGSSVLPVDLGWLAHQVRPIDGGCEMRSRFYLNVPGLRALNVEQARCAVSRGSTVLSADSILDASFARDLMHHCGSEMNHLAQFLPELHAEFSR